MSLLWSNPLWYLFCITLLQRDPRSGSVVPTLDSDVRDLPQVLSTDSPLSCRPPTTKQSFHLTVNRPQVVGESGVRLSRPTTPFKSNVSFPCSG